MAVNITIPPPVVASKTVYVALGGDMGDPVASGGRAYMTGGVLDAFVTKYAAYPALIAPCGDEVYQVGYFEEFYDGRFGQPWVYGGTVNGKVLANKVGADVHDHFLPVIGNHEGYDTKTYVPTASPHYQQLAQDYEPIYYGYDHFWTIGGAGGDSVHHDGMGFTKAELNIPAVGVTRRRYYSSAEMSPDPFKANDGVAYWRFIALNSDKDPDNAADPDQHTWLAAQMAQARTAGPGGIGQHLIVAMHHPVINSIAGGSNGESAQRDFALQLQDYTGGLVIMAAGHVHLYQRFDPVRMHPSLPLNDPASSIAATASSGITFLVVGDAGSSTNGTVQDVYVPATGAGAHADHLAAFPPGATDNYGVSVLQLEPHQAVHEHVPVDDAVRGWWRDTPAVIGPDRPPPTGGGGGGGTADVVARAVSSFPTAAFQRQNATPPRARMEGPRGGPYVCTVRVDASTSTYETGARFTFEWGDLSNTGPQTSPIANHAFTFRHAANFGWGLGRKDIEVTVTSADGTKQDKAIVTVFIMPDHPLLGIWQDNDVLSFLAQEQNVARAIDSDKNTVPIIGATASNTVNLPSGGMTSAAADTYDLPAPHCIPYLDTHWASQKPTGEYASANWTWYHVIKNRKPAALTFGGRSWPASTETPKEYVQRQCRQLYAWGKPFFWDYAQEPENDIASNVDAWNTAYPAEQVVFKPKDYWDFWDTIDLWVRTTVQSDGTIGLPNLAGSYVGLMGSTWRTGANGGPDAWLGMQRKPDMIGMSLYNNAPQAPWRDFIADSDIDKVLAKARVMGLPVFDGEVGCGPDTNDAARKAGWFADMLAALAGRVSLPNGLTFDNVDYMGMCWNSGDPGPFTDYRWFGSGVPSVVSQAVKDVFADPYFDWGFITGPPPPPTLAVSSFTPASGGPGVTVQITGQGFTGATAVKFGGVAAASFLVTSDTNIQATVPGVALDGPITVTVGPDTAASSASFDFIPVVVTRGQFYVRG